MGETVANLAVSLDFYIAESDGTVDFLSNYKIADYDFEAFAATIGGLITGSTTYEQAVGFGWYWSDKPTLVLTTRTDLAVPEGADVRFTDEPTPDAIRRFAAEIPGRLWVFGGGQVITEGLRAGAIDTLELMVIPQALGSGIPLFTEPYDGPMKLVDAIQHEDGAVLLVYDCRP